MERNKIYQNIKPFNYEENKLVAINQIINFVYAELPKWKDENKKKCIMQNQDIKQQNETILTSSLSLFLEQQSRIDGKPFCFLHQFPEEKNRTVDLSVFPIESSVHIIDFECKRLPTPYGEDRKDEYVTCYKKTYGGIQRFKLGLHGKDLLIAGMVGFLQDKTFSEMLTNINKCINLLSTKSFKNIQWSKVEQLKQIANDKEKQTWKGYSEHVRQESNSNIKLFHLWIDLR